MDFFVFFFFFQAEDGIRDVAVTGVQTCALPISRCRARATPVPPTRAGATVGGARRTRSTWRRAWCTIVDSPSTDRKSTRLNSSHGYISYAVFCLKKKKKRLNKSTHDVKATVCVY